MIRGESWLLHHTIRAEELAELLLAADETESDGYKDILLLAAWSHLRLPRGDVRGMRYLEKLETLYPDEAAIPYMKGWLEAEKIAAKVELTPEERALVQKYMQEALACAPFFPEAYWILSQFRGSTEIPEAVEDRRKCLATYSNRRPVLRLFAKDNLTLLNATKESVENWDAVMANQAEDD